MPPPFAQLVILNTAGQSVIFDILGPLNEHSPEFVFAATAYGMVKILKSEIKEMRVTPYAIS